MDLMDLMDLMGKWKKPNGKEHRWSRKQLINQNGAICQICLEPINSMNELTIDHIIPVSKGGSDNLENLRLAHEECNKLRGNGFFN